MHNEAAAIRSKFLLQIIKFQPVELLRLQPAARVPNAIKKAQTHNSRPLVIWVLVGERWKIILISQYFSVMVWSTLPIPFQG